MRWIRSKSVETLTVEQVRADKPELSEETAKAVVDFVEHFQTASAARREAHKALPLRTRVGMWWRDGAYRPLQLLFKGTLLVIGWASVLDWIGSGQTVFDYAVRIGWILIGLIGAGVALEKVLNDEE